MTEQESTKIESESESDEEGYVTPNELTFADDERPPSPQKDESPRNGALVQHHKLCATFLVFVYSHTNSCSS